jgi:membrane protein
MKKFWIVLKQTIKEFTEDKASRLAAALSYYTIFSLAPLLIIITAVAGIFYAQEDIRDQLRIQLSSMFGTIATDSITQVLDNATAPSGSLIATGIGVITLVIGATNVFAQLQDSLNTIWDIDSQVRGGVVKAVKNRLISFLVVAAISLLFFVSVIATTAMSTARGFVSDLLPLDELVWFVLEFVVPVLVFTIIFGLLFKILPDAVVKWKDVWIGALLTAVLFTIGKTLISFYLSQASVASAYGAAGSLVILLLWVYYSAQILFLGAEFTQVYARHYGAGIKPVGVDEESPADEAVESA